MAEANQVWFAGIEDTRCLRLTIGHKQSLREAPDASRAAAACIGEPLHCTVRGRLSSRFLMGFATLAERGGGAPMPSAGEREPARQPPSMSLFLVAWMRVVSLHGELAGADGAVGLMAGTPPGGSGVYECTLSPATAAQNLVCTTAA